MSGQGGSIGGIILGAVLIVVGIASQNYGLAFVGATMVAGGAYGLQYSPKTGNQSLAAAQDVKFSPAASGAPVPIVFGQARVTPNHIRGAFSLLETEEIEAPEAGKGGMGGGAAGGVIGFNYFWSWEMGLCMGTVEALGQVFSMPGESPMIDAPPEDIWVSFGVADYIELNLKMAPPEDVTDAEETTQAEGGIVRVYKGSQDQVRISSGDSYQLTGIPYRGTCFAVFGIVDDGRAYCLGSQNIVKTYQFMVRRPCECVRDNGDAVPGLKLRGSDDTENPAYHLANPAAIYWEALTNKVWGRGLSSDILDEASFVATSEYYAAQNIGLGLVIESTDDIGAFLDGIQRHVKTLLTWDGEVYKLISLLNIEQTHEEILTLRQRDLKHLAAGIPLWESVWNELRAEFTSPERGERPDAISQMDSGVVDILGGRVMSQRISLPGFNDWNLVNQQLSRLLAEMSYPWRTAEWEMNRFKSNVRTGQVVRVIWDQNTDSPITSYWLIVGITEGASDDENIKVIAVEDMLLAPVEGEELTVIPLPDKYPWQRFIPTDPDDVYLVDEPEEAQDTIAAVFEVPAMLAQQAGITNQPLIVGCMPRIAPGQNGALIFASLDNVDFFKASDKSITTIAGVLVTPMPGGQFWDRSVAGFEFDIAQDGFFGGAMNSVTQIADENAHLEDIEQHWILMGEEVMKVGLIEQVSPTRYRLRNIIRGLYGTIPRQQPAGMVLMYARYLTESRLVKMNKNLVNREYWFKLRAFDDYFLLGNDSVPAQIFHYGANNHHFLGVSQRPLHSEPVSLTDGGGTVTLVVRPHRRGAGTDAIAFAQAIRVPVGDISSQTFSVWQFDAAGVALTDSPVANAFTFTAGSLITPGYVSMVVTKLAGVATFKVYTDDDGRRSVHHAEFLL